MLDEPAVGSARLPVAVYSVARWGRAGRASSRCSSATPARCRLGPLDVGLGAGALDRSVLIPYVVTIGAIVTAAWALGFAAQQRERYVASLVARAEQAERMAEREVELAARDERSRIAREMHDVVAHGLSVIVVQADGARYAAAKDPDVAVGTLETISATGRESLTEMRRLLGLLRDGDTGVTPQPGLDGRTPPRRRGARGRDAGRGGPAARPRPRCPDGVGLAAYRIVQEALTNVRKHAGPGRHGAAARRGRPRRRGRGARRRPRCRCGLRRPRARAWSGCASGPPCTAARSRPGPVTGGGFAVSARLPL